MGERDQNTRVGRGAYIVVMVVLAAFLAWLLLRMAPHAPAEGRNLAKLAIGGVVVAGGGAILLLLLNVPERIFRRRDRTRRR
jgi:hypothetical protein